MATTPGLPPQHRTRRRADMPLLGGVRPPVAALLALLLLVAGTTALVLGRAQDSDVPRAVLSSQQHVAEDGAAALRASLDEGITDLRRSAAMFSQARPADADAALRTLGSVYRKWRGTAVVDLPSGRLLAARGENVPLAAVDVGRLADGLPPRLVRLESGQTRLLVFALLSAHGRQQLLVASDSLRVPSISTGGERGLQIVDRRGRVLAGSGQTGHGQHGHGQHGNGRRAGPLAQLALDAAHRAAGERPSETAASGGFTGASGSLLGGTRDGRRTVAGYATIASGIGGRDTSQAGALGLTVVTSVDVPQGRAGTSHRLFGLLAAGALLVLGCAVTLLLLGVLQRPLMRLHTEARRLARGDLGTPVGVPRFGEPARIGAALESLRGQLAGVPRPGPAAPARRRDRCGLPAVLLLCAVLLASWAAPLLFLLGRPGTEGVVPPQLVTDQRQRTQSAADRVRQGLNEGYADLASVATALGQSTAADRARPVLETTLAEHHRYRSLYVVDAAGTVLASAGAEPRTERAARVRDGVAQLNTSGREPLIAAVATVRGAAKRFVVGEFTIPFLNGMLNRPGLGKVWLVDRRQRILAANRGFVAFTPLPGRSLRATSRPNGDAATGSLLHPSSEDPALAAAAPLAGNGPSGHLRWHVVSLQPASWLSLPEYEAKRRTMLAGILGLASATTCLGWLYIVVVRPLRALAGGAEALAGGELRTVLYPRHHDEVGSVARSLELIRQLLAEQERGAAPVPRPRAIPAPEPASRTAAVPTGRGS